MAIFNPCPFCTQDTGGNHAHDCPNNPDNKLIGIADVLEVHSQGNLWSGWICPRCGKAWGPMVQQCDCNPLNPYCLSCDKQEAYGMIRLTYPSAHDGDWLCMECIDALLEAENEKKEAPDCR